MYGQERDNTKCETFEKRFQLGEFLGKGTFGKVYKCVERESEICFAVKQVTVSDEEIGKDLDGEVAIWKEVKHTNVASLLCTFSEGRLAHLVMEYVEGKSLFDEMVLQIAYSEKEACAIMEQVCKEEFNLFTDFISILSQLIANQSPSWRSR